MNELYSITETRVEKIRLLLRKKKMARRNGVGREYLNKIQKQISNEAMTWVEEARHLHERRAVVKS